MQPECQHAFPYLPVLRYIFCTWYLPSSHLIRFPSYGFQVVISEVHRLSRILLMFHTQVHSRLMTCSMTPVIFVFLLPRCLFFCHFILYLMYLFSCLFVRVIACSLPGWRVPLFPHRMSLLRICSCRLVSSSRFQCFPGRCRGAWRMLSSQPLQLFEYPGLVFLWCCINFRPTIVYIIHL